MTEDAVPLEEQIEEIERELGVRRRKYPSWVARGTLQAEVAQQRYDRMAAVLRTLRAQKQPELGL